MDNLDERQPQPQELTVESVAVGTLTSTIRELESTYKKFYAAQGSLPDIFNHQLRHLHLMANANSDTFGNPQLAVIHKQVMGSNNQDHVLFMMVVGDPEELREAWLNESAKNPIPELYVSANKLVKLSGSATRQLTVLMDPKDQITTYLMEGNGKDGEPWDLYEWMSLLQSASRQMDEFRLESMTKTDEVFSEHEYRKIKAEVLKATLLQAIASIDQYFDLCHPHENNGPAKNMVSDGLASEVRFAGYLGGKEDGDKFSIVITRTEDENYRVDFEEKGEEGRDMSLDLVSNNHQFKIRAITYDTKQLEDMVEIAQSSLDILDELIEARLTKS